MCLCWRKLCHTLARFSLYFMLETICQLLIIIVIKNQFNIKNSNKWKVFVRMKMSVFMKQCENLNNFVSSWKTFNLK